MNTTTDPAVVFGVVLATAGAWLLISLLMKRLIDRQFNTYTPATTRPATPCFPTALADRHPHALTTAPDETQPITTVKVQRARHRKGSRCS